MLMSVILFFYSVLFIMKMEYVLIGNTLWHSSNFCFSYCCYEFGTGLSLILEDQKVVSFFSLLSFLKDKNRLMRSPSCVFVLLCVCHLLSTSEPVVDLDKIQCGGHAIEGYLTP
jgi:hypothetical protein